MPLTFDTLPTRLTIHYRDFNGVRSSHWTQLLQGLDKPQIEPLLLSLCQASERVTDCMVEEAQFTVPLKAEYGAADLVVSDTSRVGVFIVESVIPGDRYIFQIPGILPEKLVTAGPWAGMGINLGDPDIAAVVDLLLNGDGTVAPISYGLNDLFRITTAYRQHRGL